MVVILELLILQRRILRLDLLQPDMVVGAVEREMFVQEELQPCSHMGTEAMLCLVEAVRPFDIGKVPAGSTENERRQSFGAKRIDQRGSLNGKGADSGGTDVGLPIVDGAFDREKFEWVEIVCLGRSTFSTNIGTLVQFLRGNVCSIRPGDCPAIKKESLKVL